LKSEKGEKVRKVEGRKVERRKEINLKFTIYNLKFTISRSDREVK